MEHNENILLTKKLEKITTGKPWRVWMALKGLNPAYMKKSVARQEFENSVEKIRRRANRDEYLIDDFVTKDLDFVPEYYGSHHPLHQEIRKLNHNMPSSALKYEVEWIADELNICLKGECYKIARGLVDYLLVDFDKLKEELKARLLPMIFETLIAVGNKKRALSLFVQYAEHCPKTDRMASIEALIFSATTLGSKQTVLPSGKLNALSINKRIESGDISTEDALSITVEYRQHLNLNPQLYLLLHNSLKNSNVELSLFALNELFRSYKLPEIMVDTGTKNFLGRISFESDHKISGGPLVSIIMSAYKSGETIDYAIDSLVNQTYENIEVLICDDNCGDNYFQEVQKKYASDPRIRFFKSNSNQGTYNIRNALVEEASGELITFQDSDDYSLPARIESQVEALSEGDSVACITRWLRVKPSGHFMFFRDQAALRMCVVSIMVPKKLFEVEGNYRSARFGADTEFFEHLRQTYGDKHIVKLKAPHVLGLWSSRSMTRSNGSEALEDGYRAHPRQVYAQAAFQQRYLGKDIIPDEVIYRKLKEINNLKRYCGVTELIGEKK